MTDTQLLNEDMFAYDSKSNTIYCFGGSIPAVLTKKDFSQYTLYEKIMGGLNKNPDHVFETLNSLESRMPTSTTFEMLENIINNVPYTCVDDGCMHNPTEEQQKIAKKVHGSMSTAYMARQPAYNPNI